MLTEYWVEEKSREGFWEPVAKALSHRQLIKIYKELQVLNESKSYRCIRVQWEVLNIN